MTLMKGPVGKGHVLPVAALVAAANKQGKLNPNHKMKERKDKKKKKKKKETKEITFQNIVL